MSRYRYCPQCTQPLIEADHGEMRRIACPDKNCGFVLWDNPVPVVAAVVEHEGGVILAHNKLWPMKFYGLITGFLEKTDPSPHEAVLREVKEELGLDATEANFIGHYAFQRMNQIIIAYHVPAAGEIVLGEELSEWKRVALDKARYWPAGTGFALRDWLKTRGYESQPMELPR